MSSFQTYSALNLTAATGKVIKAGPGVLASVSVNKATTGTVAIKDGNTTIATIAASTPANILLNAPIAFGSLNVSMSTAAEDVTFIYQ